MSKAKGIIDWFKTCGLVENVETFDVNQLGNNLGAGLYKQPSITKQTLADGSQIITENYYVLFRRSAQIPKERIDNEDFLEAVENWFYEQEVNESYPDIGYPVHEISATNAFYMLERDSHNAVYQLTLSVKYMREVPQPTTTD